MAINKCFFEGKVIEVQDGDKAFVFLVRSEETFNEQTYETVVRFVAFKKVMELAKAKVKKGQDIFVEGRLSSRKKEGSSGVFYNLEAVAERFIVIAGEVNKPTTPSLGRKTDDNGDNIPF